VRRLYVAATRSFQRATPRTLAVRGHAVRIFLAVLLAGTVSACGQNKGQVQTLPSGKQIVVLGVGPIYFAKDNQTALMLKYQTTLSLEDRAALGKEADEIWSSFRVDVDQAGLPTGIISANEKPTGFIVTHSRGFNFVYTKSGNGQWTRLNQ
jgi:hypothetical protein